MAVVGLGTTSSVIIGAVLGLYVPFPKKVLAGVLAFAAGSLIAALAIELGFEGAQELTKHGAGVHAAWGMIAGGFAVGAVVYYVASLFLEGKGAALRYPSRFMEYALNRKRRDASETLSLLAQCNLLRHLSPEDVEPLLDRAQSRDVKAGEVVFAAGDPGDALYIVAAGGVEVLAEGTQKLLAELGPGQPFGEMALLSGGTRTATVRAKADSRLLHHRQARFRPADGRRSRRRRAGAQAQSRSRAVQSALGGHQSRGVGAHGAREVSPLSAAAKSSSCCTRPRRARAPASRSCFGNILDTIPGCLVIGAKFGGFESLSLTLILGMFLGGIPEAAASAAMLRRAGFADRRIFFLWSTVLVAGVVAAVAGKLFIGHGDSTAAVLAQAVAGGAILALVTHAMIPESLHKGGSAVVLPAVGGFLFALYLALVEITPG